MADIVVIILILVIIIIVTGTVYEWSDDNNNNNSNIVNFKNALIVAKVQSERIAFSSSKIPFGK